MYGKIKNFIDESRTEFRHVNWPTRGEAMRLTGVVVGISLGLALFLGLFDYLFTEGVKYLILR